MPLRRHVLSAVLGACLVAGGCRGEPRTPSPAASTAGPDLARGLRAFALLRMRDAAEAFASIARAHPEAPLPRAYRALALNSTAPSWEEMAAAVEGAVGAPPAVRSHVEALRALAAYDFDAAGRAYDALVAASPRDRQVRLERGLLRLRQRNGDGAAADLQQALSIDPSFSEARPHLARAHLAAGRLPEADAAARDAVTALPGEGLPHLVQCEVRRRAGDLPGALEACTRAVERAPDMVAAYQGRAYVHRQAERFAEARDDFRTAFGLASARADAADKELLADWAKAEDISFDVAMTYLLEGRRREAEAAAEETVAFTRKARPANTVFYCDALGRIYLEHGRVKEGEDAYRRGRDAVAETEGLPDDERTLWRGRYEHGLGRARARAGRFAEARAQADLIERMIRAAGTRGAPYRPSLHYLRGYIAVEEGAWDRALAELAQASRDDPYVQWLTARAHEGRGDRKQAEAIVARLRREVLPGLGYALVRARVLAWPRAIRP